MPGPLHGIRIVDLTQMVAGPVATMILADQGADVIKIEPPHGGDYTRQVSTRRHDIAASFLNNNRNKRSVILNLKEPRAVEIVKELARDADVFVQNFRPGVADRMGVGEPALRIGVEDGQAAALDQVVDEGGDEHRLARPRQSGNAQTDDRFKQSFGHTVAHGFDSAHKTVCQG